MATTEISTASWSGFYDNDPWLNEENWKKFFGVKFTSGTEYPEMVDSEWKYALQPHYSADGTLKFDSGAVFVNGFEAQFNTETTTSVTGDEMKFFFVRLDPINKTAAIMAKDVTENDNIPNAFVDPSWQCQSRYDVPLCIAIYSGRTLFDLRRFVVSPEERWSGQRFFDIELNADMAQFSGIYGSAYKSYIYGNFTNNSINPFGGFNYKVTVTANNPGDQVGVSPIPICSNEPIIMTVINNKSTDITVALGSGGHARNRFLWGSDWENSSKTLGALSQMTFVLQQAYFDGWYCYWTITSPSTTGGSVDPEQIYTKSEVNTLIAEKADADDVYDKTTSDSRYATRADFYNKESIDEMLSEKANNLDVNRELALKADATAVSTALAGKADLSNVYTKTEADALLAVKASISKVDTGLASKADADTTYTKTETDNLLASKANSNETYTKSQTDALLDQKPFRSQVYTKDEIDATIFPRNPVTIYCDADNGDDATGDGTENNPYKTLQKAIDMVPGNGLMNTVCPTFGVYQEDIIISGKDIFIKPASTRVVEIQGWVRVENSSNVTFDGTFKIEHDASCVWVSNHSNCYFKYNGDSYRPHFLYGDYSSTSELTRNWALVADTGSQIIIPASVEITCHHKEFHAVCARYGGTIYVNTTIINTSPNHYDGVNTVFYAQEGGMIFHGTVTGDFDVIDDIEGSGVINPTNSYSKSEVDNLISGKSSLSYYVDASLGNDTTGDGTQTRPFRTLQKAVDMCPGAGMHNIHCSTGNYGYLEIVGKNVEIITNHTTDIITLSNNKRDGSSGALESLYVKSANVVISGKLIIENKNVGIRNGFSGNLSINNELTINGLISAEPTIVDGQIVGADVDYAWDTHIYNAGKLSINQLVMQSSGGISGVTFQAVKAIRTVSSGVTSIGDMTFTMDEQRGSSSVILEADRGIIMYGTLDNQTEVTETAVANGGMIRTGSSN